MYRARSVRIGEPSRHGRGGGLRGRGAVVTAVAGPGVQDGAVVDPLVNRDAQVMQHHGPTKAHESRHTAKGKPRPRASAASRLLSREILALMLALRAPAQQSSTAVLTAVEASTRWPSRFQVRRRSVPSCGGRGSTGVLPPVVIISRGPAKGGIRLPPRSLGRQATGPWSLSPSDVSLATLLCLRPLGGWGVRRLPPGSGRRPCPASATLDNGVAAVDDDRLTDHKVGVFAAKVGHQRPELLGSAHPPGPSLSGCSETPRSPRVHRGGW